MDSPQTLFRNRPFLALVLITPFLTELLCSNIPARSFFLPPIFFLLIIVYGLAVLSIREHASRRGLGLGGMLLLGLAYGIYNEGICAKTLLLNQHVPIDAFDGYAIGGINLAWAICILAWHALHSVLFPVLIIYYFFPNHTASLWIKNRSLGLIVIVFMTVGTTCFLAAKTTPPANPALLVLFVGVMALLIHAAAKVPQLLKLEDLPRRKTTMSPALAGFAFYLFYIFGLIVLAHNKTSTLLMLAYAALILAGTWQILKRKGWLHLNSLIMFILGDYIALDAFALLNGIFKGAGDIIVVGLAFLILFTISIQSLARNSAT